MLAGFVLARAAAGLSDRTISLDVTHLEQIRLWFGRPLWEMAPADADAYFGKVLPGAARGIRLSRAQALRAYSMFLELRHKTPPCFPVSGMKPTGPSGGPGRRRPGQGWPRPPPRTCRHP